MRLLRFLPGKYTFLKKIRIGFKLLKSSFKAVFFSHHKYLFFSILLTLIQFIHLKLTGLIHHRLTLSLVMTELLAGESFFEILWHDAQVTVSAHHFFTLVNFIGLLYVEIIMVLFVVSAVVHYTAQHQTCSISQSLQKSLRHWSALCAWGLLQLCAQGISSFFGDSGSFIYFVWNIITIFDVQILSFEQTSAYLVLKKCWQLFKRNVSEIVAYDLIIEGALITVGLFLYYFSRQYVSNMNLSESVKYSETSIFLILYLISSVMIFEAVVFTKLYTDIKAQ